MPATIAIVGRPNVGKSTLFNRLLKKNVAITHDRPGVTRDRIFAEADIEGRTTMLIDTGGMEMEFVGEEMEDGILDQAQEAVTEADAILLVMDGREGVTPLDREVAEFIRRSGKNVILAVNKVDGSELEDDLLADFHELGFNMLAVSAEHGYNLKTFREWIHAELLELIPEDDDVDEKELGLRLAMIGRPNAGKSSIVNKISGTNRVIVSPVAGTTRDAVDVTFESRNKRYTFIDTAGVRRKAKIKDSLERFSVIRALKASRRAHISVLVIDAEQGVAFQDKKLIEYLDREKIPFIVVVNKMDLITDRDEAKELRLDFEHALRIAPHAPVIYTSAKSGQGMGQLLSIAEALWKECGIRVTTGELNRVMREVLERHQPPLVNRRRAKFFYLTQVQTEPPTFMFFVNHIKRVKESYKRYLENQLRKQFGLKIAPIRVLYRASHEPKRKKK